MMNAFKWSKYTMYSQQQSVIKGTAQKQGAQTGGKPRFYLKTNCVLFPSPFKSLAEYQLFSANKSIGNLS